MLCSFITHQTNIYARLFRNLQQTQLSLANTPERAAANGSPVSWSSVFDYTAAFQTTVPNSMVGPGWQLRVGKIAPVESWALNHPRSASPRQGVEGKA